MEPNEPIFVYRVAKCHPTSRNKYGYTPCEYEHLSIIGINNVTRELILADYEAIIHVPFHQLKWGPIGKFIHKTDYVYVIYDILLKVPIDNKSESFGLNTLFSPTTIRIKFDHRFQEKNLKCSNVTFCIRENYYHIPDSYSIAKYPVPLTKILLFVSGHADPKSPVSYLIKDIFPLIYEFYQQIYPLLESNNI